MVRRRSALATTLTAFVGAVATATAAACAVGAEPTVIDDGGAGVPPANDAGAADTSTGPQPFFDSGTTAPPDAGPDGGPPVSCTAPAPCASARDLGAVSGDTSPTSNSRTTTGTTSEWLKLTVTEDANGVGGQKLSLKVTLSSPTASNFDVFVYVDDSGSTTSRACATVTKSSTNPSGQVDEVTVSWGEGAVANGSDDTRIVSIEVRNVAGTCSAGEEWTLIAAGNP